MAALAAALVLAMGDARTVAQDAGRGAHVFKRCALCHVVDPKAKDLLAPPLHNIVGRPAAQIPGFQYSEIMRYAGKQGLVWTEQALFHFLADPEAFMPGTYMAFSGLEDSERRDVLAYLAKLSRDWKAAEEAAEKRSKGAPVPAPAWRQLPAQTPASPSGTKTPAPRAASETPSSPIVPPVPVKAKRSRSE